MFLRYLKFFWVGFLMIFSNAIAQTTQDDLPPLPPISTPIIAKDTPKVEKPNFDPLTKSEEEYQRFIKDKSEYLKVEYDKFKKMTQILTDVHLVLDGDLEFQKPKGGGTNIQLQVISIVPDKRTKSDPVVVVLMLIASSPEGWRFLDCKDFNWLVNGEPFKYLRETYDGRVGDAGSTTEYFDIELTPNQFNKLTHASSIECKICNDEFVFNKKHFWAMRWVNEKLKDLLRVKTKE
jgi:hypothetical protein